MNFYSSLVCIEVVLCLAVISTALQKLHKCVTKNTTELLFRRKRKKEGKKVIFQFKRNMSGFSTKYTIMLKLRDTKKSAFTQLQNSR